MAMAVLTLATAAGAAGFKIAENNAMQAGYEQSIDSAESAKDQNEMYEYYMQAINLRPTNEAPYLAVLSAFLSDGVFSDDEDLMFRKMMGASSGSERTNQDYLSVNESGYHRLCKEAAMAYFYYVEGGTKTSARQWLDEIRDANDLSAADVERANLLYKITEYYASLGVTNRAGDSKASYKDYWYDLVTATSGDLVSRDNAMTALVVYKEITSQVFTLCDKFAKSGVREDELIQQLDEISYRLENNVDPAIELEGNLETKSSMVEIEEKIKAVMEKARDNVEMVYSDTSAISRNSEENESESERVSDSAEAEPTDGEET